MAKISLAMTVTVVIILALSWLADFVFRAPYPDRLAVEVAGFDATLVNRTALQRDWPKGLNALGARAQLRAHMDNVENLEPPKSVAGLGANRSAPAPELDLATLLVAADITVGERRARICATCHTFNDGGRTGVGPNLWSIVGGDIAASAAFDYSDALTAESGNWTFEKIDAFLLNPGKAVPGNKMAFQGIRRARDRADIIAFLRMQGATQIPFPEPPTPASDDSQ